MGGEAGMRGCEVADYLCEASACEGQKLGGACDRGTSKYTDDVAT